VRGPSLADALDLCLLTPLSRRGMSVQRRVGLGMGLPRLGDTVDTFLRE
jgi:hypothetical protein